MVLSTNLKKLLFILQVITHHNLSTKPTFTCLQALWVRRWINIFRINTTKLCRPNILLFTSNKNNTLLTNTRRFRSSQTQSTYPLLSPFLWTPVRLFTTDTILFLVLVQSVKLKVTYFLRQCVFLINKTFECHLLLTVICRLQQRNPNSPWR